MFAITREAHSPEAMCPASYPLEYVFFFECDVEFPQQTQILSFEGLFCMVFPLVHHILDYAVQLRPGIGEGSVAPVPGESAFDPSLVVDPLICIGLDVPYKIGDSLLRMKTDEDVNMIRHPAHREHFAAQIPYDPGDVFVNLFLMRLGNERLPAFNREDKLNDYL